MNKEISKDGLYKITPEQGITSDIIIHTTFDIEKAGLDFMTCRGIDYDYINIQTKYSRRLRIGTLFNPEEVSKEIIKVLDEYCAGLE